MISLRTANAGVATRGQPEPTGLLAHLYVGQVGNHMPMKYNPPTEQSWETLTRLADPHLGAVLNMDECPPEDLRAFYLAMGEYIVGDSYGLWLPPDANDGHSCPHKLIVTIGTRIAAMGALYHYTNVGSPIEWQLAAALLWMDIDWAGFPAVVAAKDFSPKSELAPRELRFGITPQALVAGYKTDILLWFRCGRAFEGLAIECDGHAFHEKTKEQAARDKKRDREMLTAGVPVMRFTGSEIFRDPGGCVDQVRDVASDALHRVSKAGGLF